MVGTGEKPRVRQVWTGVSQSFAVDEFEVKGGKVTVYPPEHDESQAGWYDPGRFSISWDGQ